MLASLANRFGVGSAMTLMRETMARVWMSLLGTLNMIRRACVRETLVLQVQLEH